MKKLSFIVAACLLICVAAAPKRAEWPDHPIHFIVGFGPAAPTI